ncbi:hypothetical protein PIB30_083691, partial [Stylosanthes scabra]|nr:hypothetical protein [Stylosanthes scabra]
VPTELLAHHPLCHVSHLCAYTWKSPSSVSTSCGGLASLSFKFQPLLSPAPALQNLSIM